MRSHKLIVDFKKLSHTFDIEASCNPQVEWNLDRPILAHFEVLKACFLLQSLVLDDLLSVSKH